MYGKYIIVKTKLHSLTLEAENKGNLNMYGSLLK